MTDRLPAAIGAVVVKISALFVKLFGMMLPKVTGIPLTLEGVPAPANRPGKVTVIVSPQTRLEEIVKLTTTLRLFETNRSLGRTISVVPVTTPPMAGKSKYPSVSELVETDPDDLTLSLGDPMFTPERVTVYKPGDVKDAKVKLTLPKGVIWMEEVVMLMDAVTAKKEPVK